MGFLAGKRALIVGVATDRSIAWGIAQAMHREGAELAFSYVDKLRERVEPLAASLGARLTMALDVTVDAYRIGIDDRVVLDLMKHPKLARDLRFRRALAALAPLVTIRAIESEPEHLDVALRAFPDGLGEVVAGLRRAISPEPA